MRFNSINDFFNGTTISGLNTSSISIFVVANGNNSLIGVERGIFNINTYDIGFTFSRRIMYTYECVLSLVNHEFLLMSTDYSLPLSGFSYSILSAVKEYSVSTELFINDVSSNSSTDVNK